MQGSLHPRWDRVENRGQFGKLQQLADEMAGSSQRDGAPASLRCHRNGNEFSKASGVDHFHAAEVDHEAFRAVLPEITTQVLCAIVYDLY